ncbi:MAG: VWA domain-containing protein [Chloroflexus sp.]
MVSVIEPSALWLFVLALPLLWLIWFGRADLRRRMGWVRLVALVVTRLLLLTALVLALAGLQVGQPVHATATVFLIDVSDSVAPAQQTAALDYIAQAVAAADPTDRMAVVVFGARAVVERVMEPPRSLDRIERFVITSRTNIADAVQLGLALLPSTMHQRLVLLSDGGENDGDASVAARIAAARGVPIDVVRLMADHGPDAVVTALIAPTTASVDQVIPLVMQVKSEVAGAATVQLIVDGELLSTIPVDLTVGLNQIPLPVSAGAPGFHQFEALLIAPFDTQPVNNRALAFTFVSGPPRVLLITVDQDQSAALVAAWRAAGLEVTVQSPAQVSTNPLELRAFDAIALFDTPAKAVATSLQNALITYVRELGGGLLVIGGPQSFGAGGWRRSLLESVLPVMLDPPLREERPNLGLVLVIDRSASMASPVADGRTQLDLAREAVYQTSLGLSQSDQLAIIAFDSFSDTLLPLQPLPDLFTIETALNRLVAGGGTDIRSGMELAAQTIATADARIRHIILVTDGVSATEYTDLVVDLRAQGVTVSAIAIGLDTDPALEQVAAIGGGKYYLAKQASELPQIFLEETVRVANRDLIEELFVPALALPTPWLRDLKALPPLRGRNAVDHRPTARSLLVANDGTPLLAVAQIGLGRVLAWTSDLSGRWAIDWLAWPEFPRFAANLVSEALPTSGGERLTLTTTVLANQVEIDLIALDERGFPLTLGAIQSRLSSLTSHFELTFSQIAPGRYRAVVTLDQTGAYFVQVSATDQDGQPVGSTRAGFAISYSPEYGQLAANPELLAEIARLTGGQIDAPPAAAFAPTTRAVYEVWPMVFPLLWLALILLPLDVALRRLFIRLPNLFPKRVSNRQSAAPPVPPSASLPASSIGARTDEEQIAALLAAKRRRQHREK